MKEKTKNLIKGVSSRNISYGNITYNEEFFKTWNYTHSNINASKAAHERA
jgi:hypothetical protein